MIEMIYGHLADYATVAQGNKPVIVGIFDQVYVRNAGSPVVLPGFFVVGKITAGVMDGSQHALSLRLVDEDGRQVLDPTPGIPISLGPTGPGRPLSGNFAVQVGGGMPVPRVCDYEFEILLDGKKIGAIPLYLTPAPA